jgi:hypothetical protein
MARSTFLKGQADLKGEQAVVEVLPGRTRKPGGGRRLLTADDETLLEDLERLVDPTTRGEPTSPLRWTCKSLRGRWWKEVVQRRCSMSSTAFARLV